LLAYFWRLTRSQAVQQGVSIPDFFSNVASDQVVRSVRQLIGDLALCDAPETGLSHPYE